MAENRFSGFQGAFQPDAPFAFPTSGGDNRFAAFATNDFGIDFSAPAAVVREQIAALPEEQRRPATEAWAREYVEREREEGGERGPERGSHGASPTSTAGADRRPGGGVAQ